MRTLSWTLAVLLAATTARGEVQVFENDLLGWQAASGGEAVVDFDTASGPLAGDEFSGMPGSPNLVLIEGQGLFAGDLSPLQIHPTSEPNVLGPADGSASIEGIIRVQFAGAPVTALGAWFFDVEDDFATTGFSTVPDASPEVAFSTSQGHASQSFLGFVSDVPLSSVDIHFATGPNKDGTAIDDMRYATAAPLPPPVPSLSPVGLAILAGLFVGVTLTMSRRSHKLRVG